MGTAFAQTIAGQVDAEATGDWLASQADRRSDAASRYERRSLLGEGGMGRVHVAFDRQFGRLVAVKEIAKKHAGDVAVRRFLREAIVTGNLEHPGVPAVYERGAEDGAPFYAMRRIEGRTLSDAIAACASLEDRLRLLPALVQVAHTIGYAHARGVVHRDIKPDNVIVGAHGQATVLDWGIAKVRGVPEGAESGLAVRESDGTLAGSVLGTPGYMSPEQARGDVDRVDTRADVFALGATLYHLFAGRPPYAGDKLALVVDAASRAQFTPIADAAPDMPAALRAICARAMSLDPAARHDDASVLADALAQAEVGALAAQNEGSRFSTAATAAVVLGILGLMVVVAVTLWTRTASLRELGGPIYGVLVVAALGVVLALLEWRTRGRYRLRPLLSALPWITFLFCVANAAVGATHGFSALASDAVAANATLYRSVGAKLLSETVGNLSIGAVLAVVHLVVHAFVRRAVDAPSSEKPRSTARATA